MCDQQQTQASAMFSCPTAGRGPPDSYRQKEIRPYILSCHTKTWKDISQRHQLPATLKHGNIYLRDINSCQIVAANTLLNRYCAAALKTPNAHLYRTMSCETETSGRGRLLTSCPARLKDAEPDLCDTSWHTAFGRCKFPVIASVQTPPTRVLKH